MGMKVSTLKKQQFMSSLINILKLHANPNNHQLACLPIPNQHEILFVICFII